MTVIKQYVGSEWETILIGKEGPPGIVTGPTPPTDTDLLWADTTTEGLIGIPGPPGGPFRDVKEFGAVCDGVADDTAALQAAFNCGQTVGVSGRCKITAPIVITTHGQFVQGLSPWGFSGSQSIIIQHTTGQPILVFDDVRGGGVRDLGLEYLSKQTAASAIAVKFDGIVGQVDVRNLFIRFAGVGMGYDQTSTLAGLFSSTFGNIRINEYGVTGMDWRGVNGGGTGTTFDAIYINAGGGLSPGGPTVTGVPFRIQTMHDWSFRGLHVEGCTANLCVEIANCYGLRLESVHFEGVTAGSSDHAFIEIIQGNLNTVHVGAVVVYGCYARAADGVTNYYVIYNHSIANTRLKVEQMNVAANVDVTGCSLYTMAAFGGGDFVIEQTSMAVGLDRPNFTPSDRPLVRSYNGVDAWRSGGSVINPAVQLREIWRTVAQGAPTTLTWRIGDKCWYIDPVAGGHVGLICTVAGTPGTWKTFGAITA